MSGVVLKGTEVVYEGIFWSADDGFLCRFVFFGIQGIKRRLYEQASIIQHCEVDTAKWTFFTESKEYSFVRIYPTGIFVCPLCKKRLSAYENLKRFDISAPWTFSLICNWHTTIHVLSTQSSCLIISQKKSYHQMKMIKHWTSVPYELFCWFLAGIWLCMIYPRPSIQNFIPFKNQWKTSDGPDVEFFKIFRSVITFFQRGGVEQTTILVG